MIDIENLRNEFSTLSNMNVWCYDNVPVLLTELQAARETIASQAEEIDMLNILNEGHKKHASKLAAKRERIHQYKVQIERQAEELELLRAVCDKAYDLTKELDECMPKMERNEALDFPFAGIRTELKDCKTVQRNWDIWRAKQEKADG